mmetsp:Transcript_2058/g.5771  ORF Transcript_2058/g.5771 Transcript_2058/m.5771 type:complete len:309 (-) Transcript_2058:746-1672(-)
MSFAQGGERARRKGLAACCHARLTMTSPAPSIENGTLLAKGVTSTIRVGVSLTLVGIEASACNLLRRLLRDPCFNVPSLLVAQRLPEVPGLAAERLYVEIEGGVDRGVDGHVVLEELKEFGLEVVNLAQCEHGAVHRKVSRTERPVVKDLLRDDDGGEHDRPPGRRQHLDACGIEQALNVDEGDDHALLGEVGAVVHRLDGFVDDIFGGDNALATQAPGAELGEVGLHMERVVVLGEERVEVPHLLVDALHVLRVNLRALLHQHAVVQHDSHAVDHIGDVGLGDRVLDEHGGRGVVLALGRGRRKVCV